MIDHGFIHDSVCEWFRIYNPERTEQEQYDLERLCSQIAFNEHLNLIDVIERAVDVTTAGLARSGSVYEDNLSPDILVKAYHNTIELIKTLIIVERT